MGNSGSNEKSATVPRKKWGIKNKKKVSPETQAENSRVLFLLYLIHRTWNIVVEHVDSRSVSRWRGSRRHLDSDSDPHDSELASQYSFCSCTNCKCDEDCASQCSELSCKGDFSDSMAPNSAQGHRGGWADETSREKQRPPTYNPEDYATALRKWTKRGNTHPGIPPPSHPAITQGEHQPSPTKSKHNQHNDKDYRNPCLSPGGEMSLRQFGSLSELLTKLRADLRLAFPSFVQEFISEPLDGVSLVVEALRTIQLSQSGITNPPLPTAANATPGALATSPTPRLPPAVQRRILLDELACLQCLQSCCQRYPESARRLVSCPAGLYALAACIMSTVNKSRILALQLLTIACEVSQQGHSGVSEALSTLRLRYGEPCRFRFLAGMLQSGAGGEELPAAGLKLLAAMLGGAPTPQRKLYLQAELDQAGLDVVAIRKAVARNTPGADQVLVELARYEKQLIDVDGLSEKATEAEKEKDSLKNKLDLLEKRVKILQEEKGILLSLEQCLKERCCELQEEVTSLRSEHGNSGRKKPINIRQIKRDESSPPEDEGISSSERSLSPDGDLQREPMVYEVFNVKNETILMRSGKPMEKCIKPIKEQPKPISDDEDETTIEEVIEELRNIINDAESEQYAKEKILAEEKMSKYKQQSEIIVSVKGIESRQHSDLEKKDSITSTKHNIIITDANNYNSNKVIIDSDTEIIPVKILPQPPRKSKSLVHLYIPSAQQGVICNNKNELPYDEDNHYYSSDEGSDSLLSASRCQPQLRREVQDIYVKTNNRALLNTIMDARERAMAAEQREVIKRTRPRSGEDYNRRPAVKKSDSFKKVNKSADDLDNPYFSDENTPYETVTKRENNKNDNYETTLLKQREDFNTLIESKKLTKSLDRIDEGLDSMVDIVLTSENKSYERNGKITQMHSNMDLARDSTGNIVVRSPSKRRLSRNVRSRQDSRSSSKVNQDIYETSHQSSDSSHRLYFPTSRVSSNSYDQVTTNSGSNTPFVIKTGRTNAGLYSDQNYNNNRDRITNFGSSRLQSMALSGKAFERTLSPSGMRNAGINNNYNGLAKLTDIPSGLY